MTAPKTTVDDTLASLAIPIPELGTPDKGATIPPVNDMAPDFGPPRRGRSRKRGTTPPPAPPVQEGPAPEVGATPLSPAEIAQVSKAVGVGFRVIFSIIAAKRGPHWNIDEKDEQLLGSTWGEAFAPWLVSNSKYVPLAIAALATVGVVVPRIDIDAKLAPPIEPPRNPDVPRSVSAEVPANAAP